MEASRKDVVDMIIKGALTREGLEDNRANRRKVLERVRDNWAERGGTETSYILDIKNELERLREEMLQEQGEFGKPEED